MRVRIPLRPPPFPRIKQYLLDFGPNSDHISACRRSNWSLQSPRNTPSARSRSPSEMGRQACKSLILSVRGGVLLALGRNCSQWFKARIIFSQKTPTASRSSHPLAIEPSPAGGLGLGRITWDNHIPMITVVFGWFLCFKPPRIS
jgi:hypothetical protein